MNESPISVTSFTSDVRRWMEANLPLRGEESSEADVRSDNGRAFPRARARQRQIFDAGYAGITLPKELGGRGLDVQYQRAFDDAAAPFAIPDFGPLTNTTYRICLPTIVKFGRTDNIKEFVLRVLRGEVLICQFFSEPSSGSDLASVRTRATRVGDEWLLNGQKIWSTFADHADYGFCLARSNWEVPKHAGLTWFLVPCDSAGLTIAPIRQANGAREFCEEYLDDVKLPDASRIGETDDGWAIARTMLAFERGGGARSDRGLRVDEPGVFVPDLLAALKDREVGPRDRQLLARAHVNDLVGRSLASRIGSLPQATDSNYASYIKLYRGTYTPVRGEIARELAGVDGLFSNDDSHDAPLAEAFLNGRIPSIAGGTNEMQRNAISEGVLGMPRERADDRGKAFSDVATGRS